MRTWSLRKVKSPRVALATALAFGLAGCGGVGTIGDQGPSGTLAQREYNGALYATPQSNGKVVLETEEGDGQVLVSWGKLQTGDRLAMGWMGKLYEYSHTGEAKAVQSSAVDEKLVVGGVVQPGASVGLVRFMQGKNEVPAVLTIHSFDAATSKVSYSVTVCNRGDLTCDQPLQPQILQAALNTAISVEEIYKLGFGKDQSQSTSTRLIFGLMRTDGILEGCGGGEGPCGPKPTPTPTPTPTPSPSPSPSPSPTPTPSPSPSPTPTATPTPTPTPEPTTPPAPTSTPKDESDNKGSILPWLLGAAAVGFVAWCWGFDGCKDDQPAAAVQAGPVIIPVEEADVEERPLATVPGATGGKTGTTAPVAYWD